VGRASQATRRKEETKLSAPPPTIAAASPASSGVIQVHVRELAQLFNSIDPSPFREKDLDDDASEFIVSWAGELPAHDRLKLLVHLDRTTVPEQGADALRQAVHTFFGHRADLTLRRLHLLLREGRTSLIIGLIFLTVCIFTGDSVGRRFPNSSLAEIVRESLLIGGWVAMWRPMEIFLYSWWPIRNERRLYQRLSDMDVEIRCSSQSTAN
jgi:hypothetical protein